METLEQNAEQYMEENDAVKQLLELLDQQGMGGQAQGFTDLFRYVAGMQTQLGEMLEELQGVRQELSQMQEKQPKLSAGGLMDRLAHLQEKITGISERLTAVKDYLVETAAQAASAFKEKGKSEMCRVLQKGISGVKKMLADYRGCLVDVMEDYQKTASRIDGIGDELKQIGNSVSNVGRLIAGKDAKEASGEKPGIGLTRLASSPMKKTAENLRRSIGRVDRALGSLDRLHDSLNAGKEAEKSGRASVKDKLLQMRERADRQRKAPESDREKGKEGCL